MSKISSNTEKKTSVEFQQRLLELIKDQDCTKTEFAKKVGLSKDVISRAAIYGIIPTTRSLIKIAEFLDISLDYLLGETDDDRFYKADKPTTFQKRLDELCEEKKVKYSEIATTMPFPVNSFYDWHDKGFLPSLEFLEALAIYFDVSKDYLLGRTD